QWQYLTPAFKPVYGQNRRDALAGNNYRKSLAMIVPEDRARVTDSSGDVRQGENVTSAFRIPRPCNGRTRWLSTSELPIRRDDGTVALIGGIGHDLTKLREAEVRLQTPIGGIPQIVWRAVGSGTWTWASQQWSAYTGLNQAESLGWGWLGALHPDDRNA